VTLQFDPSPELELRFAEVEATGADVHPFRELSQAPDPVARLSDAESAVRAGSPRLAEIYRPLGFEHEVRAAFTTDGTCWGIAGLLRARGSSDFADEEVEFLTSVAPVVARAIRVAAVAERAGPPQRPGTAVLIADASGRVTAATPEARRIVGAWESPGEAGLRLAVSSVIAAVRSHGLDRASARVRVPEGGWVTIAASPLDRADGGTEVAVTIEPTASSALADLLLRAHGLTARERQVCRQLFAGRSTAEVAARLFISANTVQDHLKSIFAKTGVRSRRELIAYLGARSE
jgi:DNA-binding CsgD family transcriptional regulator